MAIKIMQMTHLKRSLVVPALVMLTWLGSSAQTVHEFTVRQTVDYAMQNATAVKNALLDIQNQKEINREITAQAYPQLSGSVQLNDYLNIPTSLLPAEFFGGAPGTYAPVKFGTKYNVTAGADLSQILFDGQVFVGLQARKTTIQLYEKQKEVTAEMINENVQKIYYQLVVGRQQMTTIDANIDRLTKLLNDTKASFKEGFKEGLDVDKVEVQLSNVQTQKIKTQGQLDAGNAALKYLLHMPQNETLILTDSLTDDMVKDNIMNSEYQYADRKDYQLLQVARQLDQYNIKRYKMTYLPTLSAFANYQKNAQRTSFDFFKSGGDYFTTSLIGFRLGIPIFDGFAKKARINQARIALQRRDNNIADLKESIDNDVVQARMNVTAALTTIDYQKRNMVLAEKVYNTTRIKFDQGIGSNEEIYTAQTELTTAQNNYYSSLYDAIIARINFLQATGKLN